MLTILDGGFGTMLQAAGLPAGTDPCTWNLENPDAVVAVHRAYVEAGAQVVATNTFGANRLKYHGNAPLADVIGAALRLARRSGASRVALDIGPTGKLIAPAGDLAFEDAYAAFAEVVRCAVATDAPTARPDLILVETMSDMRELKAAVLAARENADVPVYATVALGADGKLLTGGSVEAVATMLEGLGVAALGLNCGLGPREMAPYVARLRQATSLPIVAKPNAGMPRLIDGHTTFEVGPEDFAVCVRQLVEEGATVVGGCCGTTPAHIAALTARVRDAMPCACVVESCTRVASGIDVVDLKPYEGLVIGERINPTGKKLLKEAYAKGDVAYVLREAVHQVDAGARVLDVNCGVPGLDEAALLEQTVEAVQSVVPCPIQVDTADSAALARALRRVNGKALVNSVNGKRASMDAVFPLVQKHGGVIVALCLDEAGIPPTAEGRLAVARKILAEGRRYGFTEKDFVFDALTLSVSSDAQAAVVTLETVRRLTEELHVNTVLGVSNVSFGLPDRPTLNNAMYVLAKKAGLSAAIANPAVLRDEALPDAVDVLLGRDAQCARWIAAHAQVPKAPVSSAAATGLSSAIAHGLREDARRAAQGELASGRSPMEVIQTFIVPALEEVGRGFEKGSVFLPQLLMAADAAGEAFAVVKARLAEMPTAATSQRAARPIVLATVKGDIHDIGKNIVRALLENYGFDVIDLGRDVPPERIVETARRTNAFLVGLSALMTTTVGAMAETIRQLKAAQLPCRVVVGGAVVTQEYADVIGADFYAHDAMRTVRICTQVLEETK